MNQGNRREEVVGCLRWIGDDGACRPEAGNPAQQEQVNSSPSTTFRLSGARAGPSQPKQRQRPTAAVRPRLHASVRGFRERPFPRAPELPGRRHRTMQAPSNFRPRQFRCYSTGLTHPRNRTESGHAGASAYAFRTASPADVRLQKIGVTAASKISFHGTSRHISSGSPKAS